MELCLDLDHQGQVKFARLTGVGGPALLKVLSEWRGVLTGTLAQIPLPSGHSGPELMLKELLLKARGEWTYPYGEEELCHCRAVPTQVVDQAVFHGAHTPELVSRWTSASTACGTCRKDVVAILGCRLGTKQSA